MSKTNPNILLVVLDSVRAKNTDLYGYDRVTTPELYSFSSNATLYKSAWAPGAGTPHSHSSIFTGLHVPEHRVNNRQARLTTETVWDELSDNGYTTGLFSHNSYLTQLSIGLNRPFDHVYSGNLRELPFPEADDTAGIGGNGLDVYKQFIKKAISSDKPVRTFLNGLAIQADNISQLPYSRRLYSGCDVTNAFSSWHAEQTGNWAACINYMDAHSPYIPEQEHYKWATDDERKLAAELNDYVWGYLSGKRRIAELESLENVYDECIHQADSEFGRLLSLLERRDDREDTLIILTADHGECFGEQETKQSPAVGHGGTAGPEEALLRVPLVVQHSGQSESHTVLEPVSLTAFPAAVRAARAGGHEKETFCLDSEPLAALLGLTPGGKRAKPAGADLSDYDREARIVYQREDDTVLKHLLYGEQAKTFDVTDPQYTPLEDEGETSAQAVIDAFEDVNQQPKEQSVQQDSVSSVVENRLEELGYR